MSINRDDLLAAARAGRLHYSEIDNLLIFLMQRRQQLNRAGSAATPLRCYVGSFLAACMATLCATALAPNLAFPLALVALLPFGGLCFLCRMAHRPHPRRNIAEFMLRLMALLLIVAMPLGVIALEGTSHFLIWT